MAFSSHGNAIDVTQFVGFVGILLDSVLVFFLNYILLSVQKKLHLILVKTELGITRDRETYITQLFGIDGCLYLDRWVCYLCKLYSVWVLPIYFLWKRNENTNTITQYSANRIECTSLWMFSIWSTFLTAGKLTSLHCSTFLIASYSGVIVWGKKHLVFISS